MKQMSHAQLMRRYVKADSYMVGDFLIVCSELRLTSDQIQMVQEVFDLDNDCADPHEVAISLDLLEGWRVLVSAQRRRNTCAREILNETLTDLDMAIDAKKYGEQ